MPKPTPFWKLPPSEKLKVREARKAAKAAKAALSTTTEKDSTMTANPEAAQGGEPELIYGIPRTKVVRVIDDLESARQRQADANTAHMSEWKAAKEIGAPVEPLKLCLKLNRMSSDKRRDFLHGFDELRAGIYGHWDQQPDLFQQPEDQAAAPVAEAIEAETADQDEADGTAKAAERASPTEPAPANASDWSVDGAAADADASLDQAGFVFTAGRNAGLEGKAATDNPHAEGTSSAAVWEKGRVSTAPAAAEVESYNAGWAAQAEGVAREANPHAEGSDDSRHWFDGFDAHAKKAAGKAKRPAKKAAAPVAEEPDLGGNVTRLPLDRESIPGVVIHPAQQGGDVYSSLTH